MNSKNSILLVDPEFDPNTAENCNLLIKITANSISYAIVDKHDNQIKAVYDQQECIDVAKDFANKIKTDSYLSLPFKEIKASVFTENAIAVPDDFFHIQHLNQYSKYFNGDHSKTLYTQPFKELGFTSIFALSSFLEQTLASSLIPSKLYDHTAPLLSLSKQKNTVLLLDFTASSFHVLYCKNGKPVFQNYYEIEDADEFNYYLLFIINQLKINITDTEVNLTGIIHEEDAHYRCLQKYFETIHFTKAVDEIGTTILDDMPAHYYTSLLALDLCE